jgi:hypothetical protein
VEGLTTWLPRPAQQLRRADRLRRHRLDRHAAGVRVGRHPRAAARVGAVPAVRGLGRPGPGARLRRQPVARDGRVLPRPQRAYGTLSIVSILVFVGILAAVNYLASRQNKRWDFTSNQVYSLSDQTIKILKELDAPVKFTVFDRELSLDGYRDRLESYTYQSSQVTAEFIDPEKNPLRAKAARSPRSAPSWSSTRTAPSGSPAATSRTSPTRSSRPSPARPARSTSRRDTARRTPPATTSAAATAPSPAR